MKLPSLPFLRIFTIHIHCYIYKGNSCFHAVFFKTPRVIITLISTINIHNTFFIHEFILQHVHFKTQKHSLVFIIIEQYSSID